jgi:hypothetical protein
MFIAPDGAYTATFPSPLRRVGAGAIDWLICGVIFVIASIVAGVFEAVGAVSFTAGDLRGIPGSVLITVSQVIVAAPVVAYFAYYWATGATLGMRALDFELVREQSGRPPGWRRTVPRGALAFVLALAVDNVYLVLAGDPLGEYSTAERIAITVSVVLVVLLLVAKAWMLVDGRRRSLLDRLFGLVYVEELVFTREGALPWTRDVR